MKTSIENLMGYGKQSTMKHYSAEWILESIRIDLLRELDFPPSTPVSILEKRGHRHSDSMIVNAGKDDKARRIFVKHGARFSGGHGWDVQSEFEGYSLVNRMALDTDAFYSVRPLLFRKDPHIIATLLVGGRPFHGLIGKSIGRFSGGDNFDRGLRLTRSAARWLKRFMAETEGTSPPATVSTVVDFCKERMREIAERTPGFERYGISKKASDAFIEKTFGVFDGEEVAVVRNHGDFAPHNMLVDERDRLCVIDIGFSEDGNNPLPYEDAVAFSIYMEQMRNNPIYRPQGPERILETFSNELVGDDEREAGKFAAAYLKKVLAHLAWLVHPERKPVFGWTEHSFRKWGDDRLKRFCRVANAEESSFSIAESPRRCL